MNLFSKALLFLGTERSLLSAISFSSIASKLSSVEVGEISIKYPCMSCDSRTQYIKLDALEFNDIETPNFLHI